MDKTRGAWLLTLVVTVQAGLAGFAGFGLLSAQSADTLPSGIRFGDLPVGGMAADAARNAILADSRAAGVPERLDITLDKDTFSVAATDIGIGVDPDALDRMLAARQAGSSWDRLLAGFSIRPEADATPMGLPLAVDDGLLRDEAETIAARFLREPREAQPRMDGAALAVEPEVIGRFLDVPAFTAWLVSALGEGRLSQDGILSLDPSAEGAQVYATARPDVLSDAYIGMRLAGSGRVDMVEGFGEDARLLSERLDGLLLASGDTLDFNRRITPAVNAIGSIDSPSRAASAVFAAMLPVRGVTVVERQPAPYAANYAAPGQEALAGDGIGNLVLRNDSGRPLLLLAQATGGTLQVAVYAALTEAPATLFSDVTETTEPPLILSPTRELAPDEVRVVAQGRAGMEVNVYRVDGTGKTLLHTDRYPPQNRVLEVGMPKDPRTAGK